VSRDMLLKQGYEGDKSPCFSGGDCLDILFCRFSDHLHRALSGVYFLLLYGENAL